MLSVGNGLEHSDRMGMCHQYVLHGTPCTIQILLLSDIRRYPLSCKAIYKHLIFLCKHLLRFQSVRTQDSSHYISKETQKERKESCLFLPYKCQIYFFVIPAYSRSCYMPDCIWFLSRHPKGKNKGKVSPTKLMLYINNNNLPCFWIFVLAFKIILMNVDIKILKSFFLPVSMSRGVQGEKARDIILRVVTSGPFFVFPDRSTLPLFLFLWTTTL